MIELLSINLGASRKLLIEGRLVASAIHKQAVQGPVAAGPTGLGGDEQADLSVHGGLSKAVYAYPSEHYAFWQTVRAQAGAAAFGEALPPGAMGENLTLKGITEDQLFIGDQLQVGTCVLAVSEPRFPCFKFAHAMGFAQAVKLMVQSGYCGSYLAVLQPGELAAGQAVTLVPGPRDVSVRELFRVRARA